MKTRYRLALAISGTVLTSFSLIVVVSAHPSETGRTTSMPSASFAAPDTTAQDMTTVRQRLRASFVPAADAKFPGETAENLLKTMQPDGSFPDQVYTDKDRENWKAGAHLGRLLRLTREYYQPDSALSKQPGVKDRIITSLGYWLRVDPTNDNWWHNEIGVPLQVGELLLLLGDDAPPELCKQGTELMKRSQMAKMTGQNLVWTAQITVVRGCLSDDPALVASAYDRMWQEVRYAGPKEEGIQIDNSFHQHGPLLYAGGYGAGFTGDVARFSAFAQGTRFALSPEKKKILEGYVLDGQQWMIRGQQWDYGATGRELIRKNKSAAGMARPVAALALDPGPRQKEMAAFAARLKGEANAAALSGNRHYWLSDYMSHVRPGYFASTRMFSTRIANTDGLTNGENKTSHHIADGAMYLARDGQEYVGIYPVWDWLRIPGTTVEQNTPLVPNKVRRMGTTSFVGGVSDGTYGASAMDLVTGEMKAKKAWFYFDKEIVCLGTGITCTTANPINTTVNQTLLRGSVKTAESKDLPRGEKTLTGASWAWHDGFGYIFPAGQNVHLRNDAQTGSLFLLGPWPKDPITKDVFSLWIDHGATPQNGTYSYVIVPGSTAEQTAADAAKLPVQVVSNTPELQAVWHPTLNQLQAVYRAPGVAMAGDLSVHVDTPCILLMRRDSKGIHLAVSNPENTAATVNITVAKGASSGKTGQTVKVQLPGGLEGGRSVFVEVK
jgi:chondroitin AC lyase